jgi:hypothetical protein
VLLVGQRRNAVSAPLGAALAFALVLSGCATAVQQGSVAGHALLYGMVPGGGRRLTIGAVGDGKLLAAAKIRPNGGRFDLSVPPGGYQVGLWLPGARQLAPKWMICAAPIKVSVIPGRETAVTLTCFWH